MTRAERKAAYAELVLLGVPVNEAREALGEGTRWDWKDGVHHLYSQATEWYKLIRQHGLRPVWVRRENGYSSVSPYGPALGSRRRLSEYRIGRLVLAYMWHAPLGEFFYRVNNRTFGAVYSERTARRRVLDILSGRTP